MNRCLRGKGKKVVLVSADRILVGMGVRVLSACLIEQGFAPVVVLMETEEENFREFYWKDLEKICSNAELIGISCMTAGVQKAIEIKKHLKNKCSAPIIVGGIHASLSPEGLLNDFELLCHGEGEDLIVELAKRLSNNEAYHNIPGLWLKSNGTVVRNKNIPLGRDLNDYPFPDYDLSHQFILKANRLVPIIPKSTYMRLNSFTIMGSRGCPHNCTYCCSPKIIQEFPWMKRVRHYSIDYLISHLKEVRRIYPEVRRFWIEDDTFFAKGFDEISEFSQRYKKEVNIPFEILISPWTFSEDKIKVLIEAGMDKLIIGIQSGSENVTHNIYNRNISNKKIMEIVKSLHQYSNMVVCYDFIVVNPFETEEDLIYTIQFIKNLPAPFIIYNNSLAFYPGTKLYEMALKSGIDITGRKEHFTEISQGYKILKNANMRHKLFHFIMLFMGGNADNVKIGRIRRFFISDKFISFYSFLNQKIDFVTNNIICIIVSIFLLHIKFKKRVKRALGPKICSDLRLVYRKLLRK